MADFPAAPPGIFSPAVLRRLLAIFLPAALLTGAVVLALYYQDLTNERALYEQAAADRVDLHTDIIRRELKSVESDLLYLANQAVLRGFLAGRSKSRQELQDEYVLFCRQRGVYDQIRYLDTTGHERVRINYNDGRPAIVPESELQAKAGRYYFAQAMLLDRGEVFVSPFDLNVEHDQIEQPLKPMIRFATPVFDRQGVKRGILILNYLGTFLLHKLGEVSAGFPGSVWLLNRDGFFLRGPSAQDEWGFMLGHDRTFAMSFPDAWPHLAGAERGQLRTERGLYTFRTLPPRGALPTPRQEDLPGGAGPDTQARDAGLMVVAHIPAGTLEGRSTLLLRRLLLLYGVVLLPVLVLAWYLAHAGALRRDHERHLADAAARLRTLSARLLTAQEDERRSLSRDLHDELGQVVTSVTLDLQRATRAGDRERKDDLIGRALHGTGCLLDRLHEISARLRPMLLDDLGLKDAVQSLLSEYEQRTGIVTRAELHFEQAQAPPAVSQNVYRILQEALTNVSKHARADVVFVALRVADGLVVLTVRDTGVGLAPAALDSKRLGILGMRERAELLDGTFVLKAQPGQGTEVQVTIPIPTG
ncbi:MAG TPA: ATP-binding protein [Gemmataceae bacterium]|jgi:signal transduction histidine kinase|nr:ATP-binding protein [Gemmataceae bacterium]